MEKDEKAIDMGFDLADSVATMQFLVDLIDMVQTAIGGFGKIGECLEQGKIAKALEYAKGGEEAFAVRLGEVLVKNTTPLSPEDLARFDEELGKAIPVGPSGKATVH